MAHEKDESEPVPDLARVRRAIVSVDVVESVRHMQDREDDFIRRWTQFVDEVVKQVLPLHQGRFVKSHGDGMLLEFEDARSAAAAALDMQGRSASLNRGRAAASRIDLRVGAHVADVVVDQLDIYGQGVNLAARLHTLARPGEVVASVDLCDELLPEVDCVLEDLGDCDLKGIAQPVRAYRLGTAMPDTRPAQWEDTEHMRPLFLVLPLEVLGADPEARAAAQVMCDDLVVGLSASPHWRVVSRLTAGRFEGRPASLQELRQRLQAHYVLSGSCHMSGDTLKVHAELADTHQGSVLWAGAVQGRRADLMAAQNPLANEVVDAVTHAVFSHELRRARAQPLPNLRSFSLLFGAISLMHRLSRADFERAWEMLEHLAERHPRAPEPRVWAAKWHALKVTQGWSSDPRRQTLRAHDSVQRALDQQADHSLGLAIDGLIAGFLNGDLDTAARRYDEAIAANPSESMAWLFKSALMAYTDRGNEAVNCANNALRLSPFDPMRYFYDSFVANALLAAGRHQESIEVGQRSIRANATHMPTHRSLAIAQALAGQVDDARRSVLRLLRLRPDYTLGEFRERYAGRHGRHAQTYFEALETAGLPER